MGVTGQATQELKIGVKEGCLDVSLSNFRGPAVCGDKVRGVIVGMGAKVEWKKSLEMKK